MKIVGLITEYNPFHNGHLYHIKESLRVTGADAAVVVMSGLHLDPYLFWSLLELLILSVLAVNVMISQSWNSLQNYFLKNLKPTRFC